VGGDLFDVARLPNGKLAFMVADVSGKGLGAALLMSNILASFRILYNVTEFSLEEVVSMVSHQLYVCSTASDFATLFVGVIDPVTHRLQYINAGHNPPIVLRADGRHEHLEPDGIMIGAFDGAAWTAAETELGGGDGVLVFTDGVTEAEGVTGQYSEDRLEKLVLEARDQAPAKLLETIMNDIMAFIGDQPRSDDITMLALQRTG
jgi:sigma-B regulation protein RsbU (phosphoserine phosphatase)